MKISNLFRRKPKCPFKTFNDGQGVLLCSHNVKSEGLPLIKDNSVDLIVTSPPYNLGIAYDSYKDSLPWDAYYNQCRRWLKECYRVLKPDGRMCLNHYIDCGNAKERTYPLMKLNLICCEEIGFKFHGMPLWADSTVSSPSAWGSWLSASSPYVNQPYEGILILYKERWKKESKGESTISKEDFIMACHGLWKIPTDKERLQVATFPVALPKLCIDLLTYKGDVVLDPFNGSGTTAVACVKTQRKFIGIELSKQSHIIAIDRVSKILLKEKQKQWWKRGK